MSQTSKSTNRINLSEQLCAIHNYQIESDSGIAGATFVHVSVLLAVKVIMLVHYKWHNVL
jgi:uncharacterized UPF0160 family protein